MPITSSSRNDVTHLYVPCQYCQRVERGHSAFMTITSRGRNAMLHSCVCTVWIMSRVRTYVTFENLESVKLHVNYCLVEIHIGILHIAPSL